MRPKGSRVLRVHPLDVRPRGDVGLAGQVARRALARSTPTTLAPSRGNSRARLGADPPGRAGDDATLPSRRPDISSPPSRR